MLNIYTLASVQGNVNFTCIMGREKELACDLYFSANKIPPYLNCTQVFYNHIKKGRRDLNRIYILMSLH